MQIFGELCPFCRYIYTERLKIYGGDWTRVIQDVRVKRLILSEKDRVGIGTFQPKDEKNQDSTELTGDINYRKIAEYGSDSDPRAFNFDGEFNVANRGIVEFVEVLKLDVAFLYDLLGASQEHKVKPKKFAQTDIDEVIVGHTNEPEYRRLQNNEFMEALRDRTVKIDVPYVTRLQGRDHASTRRTTTRRRSRASTSPRTPSRWPPCGPSSRGWSSPRTPASRCCRSSSSTTARACRASRRTTSRSSASRPPTKACIGISPRYVQDKISNALVAHPDAKQHQPVHGDQRAGGRPEAPQPDHLRGDAEPLPRSSFRVVKEEYENIVKNEVQRAIAADEDALKRLCGNYIDNVKAYTQREKVKNKFTGQYEEPDHRLMRSIEEKIDIPESRKDDFRREIMNHIGALAIDGKTFDYKTNARCTRRWS